MTENDDLNLRINGDASGMEKASSRASQAMGTVGKAASDLQKAFATVGKAIDPMWAATDKYNKAQQANTKLMKEGAIESLQWANNQVKLREAFEQSVAKLQAMSPAAKAAKSDQDGLARAITAVATAARLQQREVEKANRTAAATAKEAARSAAERARAERQAAAAVGMLRSSLDPVYAAQQRYNATMATATSLLMQNKLKQGEWNMIQGQARKEMELNSRSLGRMNQAYVMVGYQVQDVVASVASGINPFVILAQQGGQTAAALSTMGGTAGKVAAFFAGPWGAAILAAVTVMGMLIFRTDDAKKKTEQLKTAEDARRLTVKELTKALEEFNDQQRQANTNSIEAIHIAINAAKSAKARFVTEKSNLAKEKADLEAQINDLQGKMSKATGKASIDMYSAQLAGLNLMLESLNTRIKANETAIKNSDAAITESEIPMAMARAEAATNGATAAQHAFYDTQSKLYADRRKGLLTQVELENKLTEAIKVREKAEEEWSNKERERRKNRDGNTTEQTAKFINPLGSAGTMTSGFGARSSFRGANGRQASTNHAGVDFAAPAGTRINAAQTGTVEEARYSPSLGYFVVLRHGAGVKTKYGHMKSMPDVTVGETVQQGQKIGEVGKSGTATGNHLHYQVELNGKPIDPMSRGGIFPIDTLEAETDALQDLEKAREQALQNYVAGIEHEQAIAGENHTLVLQLQDQKIAALRDHYGSEAEETVRAQRQRVMMERRFQQEVARETLKGIRDREEMTESAIQSEMELEEIRQGMKNDNAEFRMNNGMTDRDQIMERARMLDEMFQMQLAHERRMYEAKLASLRAQLDVQNLEPEARAAINRELERLNAEHQQRIAEMGAQYGRDANRLALDNAQLTANKWKEIGDTISQSLSGAFQGIWTHSQSLFQSMINLADQLVFKFFDMGLQMLTDWAMRELGMTALTQAAEATRTATKATAAASQTAIGAAAATTQVGQQAAVGAAGAFSSTVVIPFIGPVAAPAAAAMALAAILGFGALISAKGGYGRVEQDGQIAELHKDEMVLPAWIASPLRASLSAPSSGGMMAAAGVAGADARSATHMNTANASTFNYQPRHEHYNADLGTMLRRDAGTLRKWFRNEMRNGAFGSAQ